MKSEISDPIQNAFEKIVQNNINGYIYCKIFDKRDYDFLKSLGFTVMDNYYLGYIKAKDFNKDIYVHALCCVRHGFIELGNPSAYFFENREDLKKKQLISLRFMYITRLIYRLKKSKNLQKNKSKNLS